MQELYTENPPEALVSYSDKLINGKTLKDTVSASYSVCQLKRATMPEDQTPQNLSSTIMSIPSYSGSSNLTLHFVDNTTTTQQLFETKRGILSADAGDLSSVGDRSFRRCSDLTAFIGKECTLLDNEAFSDCVSLVSVYVPKCEMLCAHSFYGNHNLSSISLPKCRQLAFRTFMNSYQLTCLEIGTELTSVCEFGRETFLGTPLYSNNGVIKVPAELVSSYQTANGWKDMSSIIEAI